MNNSIWTPRTGSEVNLDWLQKILQEYEEAKNPDVKVTVLDIETSKATKPGDNYNSDLYKVDSSAKVISNDEQVDEKNFRLFLKFESPSVFAREVNRLGNNHLREFLIYKEVINELKSLEGALDKKYIVNIPELFYGHHCNDDYVLAMQNVSSYGYTTNDKKLGLNYGQLNIALKHLAYLHALTYVYDKKFSFLKKFPVFQYSQKAYNFFNSFLQISVEAVYEYAKFKGLEFASKIENFKEIVNKVEELKHNHKEHVPICLTQGDFWNNNLLFRYDDPSKYDVPTDVVFVDWQVCQWNNPLIDLQYLFYTSTTWDTRKEHLEKLLLHYHTTFTEVVEYYDCTPKQWTYQDFRDEYKRLAPLGFVFGAALTISTLSQTGETMAQSSSNANPRTFGFGLKVSIARFMLSILTKPSLSSLVSKMARKMLEPFKNEICGGKNEVLQTRLLNLILEASENGTFNDF